MSANTATGNGDQHQASEPNLDLCADVTSGFKNLGDLISRLQSTFYVGSAKDSAAPPPEAASTATQAGSDASPVATPMSAAAARSVEDDPFKLSGMPHTIVFFNMSIMVSFA